MAEQNGFADLMDAVRKYVLPKFAGGGYTKEEEKAIKENLEKAEKTAKDKTPSDYANDVGYMFLGVDLKKSGNQMIMAVVFILILLGLTKD